MELFSTRGFDETTMEQIAEQAEVGSTTLYRYFPSKHHLALGPFNNGVRLGDALLRRPPDEPLAEALGAVVLDALDVDVSDFERFFAVRQMVDQMPGPRAAMWELLEEAQINLNDALATRMQRDGTSSEVLLTSRITFAIWELAWVRWGSEHTRSPRAVGADLLADIGGMALAIPAPPADPAATA
jgi:AcrR family transcriptional regulator